MVPSSFVPSFRSLRIDRTAQRDRRSRQGSLPTLGPSRPAPYRTVTQINVTATGGRRLRPSSGTIPHAIWGATTSLGVRRSATSSHRTWKPTASCRRCDHASGRGHTAGRLQIQRLRSQARQRCAPGRNGKLIDIGIAYIHIMGISAVKAKSRILLCSAHTTERRAEISGSRSVRSNRYPLYSERSVASPW